MLKALELSPSKFYQWKRRFGLPNYHNGKIPKSFWLELWEVEAIVEYAKQHPGVGYRYLTYKMLDRNVVAVSPATTYRVLKVMACYVVGLLPAKLENAVLSNRTDRMNTDMSTPRMSPFRGSSPS